MTDENFRQLTEALLSKKPFQVFTIQLHNGERFEIDHPRTLAYNEGLAAFISPGPVPVWFDHESVSDVFMAPAHSEDAE